MTTAAPRNPAVSGGHRIIDLYTADALRLEGLLAIIERDTRALAARKASQGYAVAGNIAANRAECWARIRVAIEAAFVEAPRGLDSPYGAGESVEASRG